MNILILNRRDIYNPLGGGAEKYTLEVAKGLLERGHKVVWFSSTFPGAEPQEKRDGILYIRKGSELTTHLFGLLHALRNRRRYDLIIEEFNGIGYMTFPLRNSILLIHQLYQEFWTAEMGRWAFFMKYVEKFLLSFYKNKFTITVSPSTKEDLEALGFKRVEIVENGVEPVNVDCRKEERLTLIYLGRLRKTKNPEDAIRIFLKVKESIPDARLVVMGTGPLEEYLRSKYRHPDIDFRGFVSEEEKYEWLCRGHFLLIPSIREGWGIVVIEANMLGTVAVGYRVKGLKDSIRDGYSGFLVSSVEEAASRIVNLWSDRDRYKQMSRNAREWASRFTWDKTREKFINALNKAGFPV